MNLTTTSDWLPAIAGKPENPAINELTGLIAAYHMLHGTDVVRRARVLDQIGSATEAMGIAMAADKPLHEAYSAAVGGLRVSAGKMLRLIERAGALLGKVRQVMIPTRLRSLPGPALSRMTGGQLADLSAPGGRAGPSATNNYWLELMDPRHRSWGHEEALDAAFETWLNDTDTKLGLFDYLGRFTGLTDLPSIVYLRLTIAGNSRYGPRTGR